MIITCIVVPWRHLLSKWHWQSTLTILLTTWMHVQKCGYCLFNFSAGVTVCILDLILFYMGNRNRFETKGNLFSSSKHKIIEIDLFSRWQTNGQSCSNGPLLTVVVRRELLKRHKGSFLATFRKSTDEPTNQWTDPPSHRVVAHD